jgi:very-short-patch-repair endonuclease
MRAGYDAKGSRFSSKAERALGEALRPYGYRRHQLIKTGDIKFDVDIVSEDMTVWVESDGEYHFRKVHEGHNFDATRLRDQIEEAEAVFRKVLLVRVNNQTTTIDEQVAFVMTSVASWDRVEGKIVKLGFDDL